MNTLANIAWVALGGAGGAAVRYAFSLALQRVSLSMPWGTLAANWTGCFVMGILAAAVSRELPISPAARLLLATGFCGGLTTFSTFMYELHGLVSAREVLYGTLYFLASMGGCAVAFLLGMLVIQLCIRH